MTKLDGDILTLGLSSQLFAEGAGKAWVCMQRPNGEIVEKTGPFAFMDPEQKVFARDVLRAINRHAWQDGAWVVAWTDFQQVMRESGLIAETATRMILLWKDKDGDVPFTIDDDRPFWRIVEEGTDSFVNKAIMAHDWYSNWIKGMEIRPEQMIQQARGQRATGAAPEQ